MQYSISEQQISKATIDITNVIKNAAQKQVARDEQEIEKGEIKEY